MKYREDNIRPFRQLKNLLCYQRMHKSNSKPSGSQFWRKWKMLVIWSDINSDVIKNRYAKTTEYLSKNVCSFLWEKEKGNVENLTVGSWLTYTQRAYIKKNGNQSDIANLPTETRYNMSHQTQRKRKKQWVNDSNNP